MAADYLFLAELPVNLPKTQRVLLVGELPVYAVDSVCLSDAADIQKDHQCDFTPDDLWRGFHCWRGGVGMGDSRVVTLCNGRADTAGSTGAFQS